MSGRNAGLGKARDLKRADPSQVDTCAAYSFTSVPLGLDVTGS